MIKRALFFSTPYCLSLKNSQMIINTREMPEMKRSVPIEDIGCVVLEHQQTSITLPLLNALSDNNVAVILCGENRMPNAMLMNLDSNSTQGESYRAQIEASETLKKGLWRQVVEAKIRNQAALLESLGREGDILKPYWMNVKSGDADNREGIASSTGRRSSGAASCGIARAMLPTRCSITDIRFCGRPLRAPSWVRGCFRRSEYSTATGTTHFRWPTI